MFNNKKELTDKQQAFLDAVFGAANGDLVEAARIAGYAQPECSVYNLVKALKNELVEQAQLYLAMNGLKAAKATTDVMDNPTNIGNNVKLAAASSILDRIGVVKQDQLNITSEAPVGIFILPPKAVEPDTVEASNE